MPADARIKAGPIPDDVRRYWQAKKLRPAFSHLDVWREEHGHAFTVAKVMRLDALKVLQNALDTAIAEGHDFKRFVREVQPRLVDAGWWDEHEVEDPETGDEVTVNPPARLKLIFDTNVRVARAVGQWDRIQKGAKLRPYLLYGLGPSKRHREQHAAWNGVLLPVDDPFWQYAFPPNGFNCRCHVRSVTKAEFARLVDGGTVAGAPEPILDDDGNPTGHLRPTRDPVITKRPKVPLVPWTNKRTGAVQLVRAGIDPGFDKPPGAGRADVAKAQKKRVRTASRRAKA